MSNVGDPGVYGEAVTPSDTVNTSAPFRSLYVGGTGNISVQMRNGAVVFNNVPVGIHPIQGTRVNLTGTSATNIVALW